MVTKVVLLTKLSQLEYLHKEADRKKRVSVDAETLRNLLTDHHTMARALYTSTSFKVIEPTSREKL